MVELGNEMHNQNEPLEKQQAMEHSQIYYRNTSNDTFQVNSI